MKRYTPPICHACIPQGVKQLIKQLIHPIRILLDWLFLLLTNPDPLLFIRVTAKSMKYVHLHRKNCIVMGDDAIHQFLIVMNAVSLLQSILKLYL